MSDLLIAQEADKGIREPATGSEIPPAHSAATSAARVPRGTANGVCPAVPACPEIPGVHREVAVAADVNQGLLATFKQENHGHKLSNEQEILFP